MNDNHSSKILIRNTIYRAINNPTTNLNWLFQLFR